MNNIMKEIYRLDTSKLPTLLNPHDCIITEIKKENDFLVFEFENNIYCHDSIRSQMPNAKSLVIRYHLIDEYTIHFKRWNRLLKRSEYIELKNESKLFDLCSQYVCHYIADNRLVISLFTDKEYLLNLDVDYVEYDWEMKDTVMGIIYECEETSIITEKEYPAFSQFITAKRYSDLYEEEFKRRKNDIQKLKDIGKTIYAIPYNEKPSKVYNGADRQGLDVTSKTKKQLSNDEKQILDKFYKNVYYADELMESEDTALCFLNLFEEAENYDLLWVKSTYSKDSVPNGYKFIGYDITYIPDFSGAFSIICDCMFLPRWHGFDDEGTLFIPDFYKLNNDGLFNTKEDAYSYMIKYLSEDWSERGDYCILEIYRKEELFS